LGIEPILFDNIGDTINGDSSSDIKCVYAARDSKNLYIMFETKDKPNKDVGFLFGISQNNKRNVYTVGFRKRNGEVYVSENGDIWAHPQNGTNPDLEIRIYNARCEVEDVAEFVIPLSDIYCELGETNFAISSAWINDYNIRKSVDWISMTGIPYDLEKMHVISDPLKSDTDGGGEDDYSEVINGRDPKNPNDDIVEDTQPPSLELIVKPNKFTNDNTITFIWTGKDNSTKDINLVYSLNIDDTEWTPWKKETKVTFKNLNEGKHSIKIRCKDLYGNISEVSYSFVIDKTPPELFVNIPDEVNDPDLTITGSVKDNLSGIKYLKINEEDITISSDGSFSYTLTLNEGENTITFELEDKAGNKIDKTFTVNYIKRIILKLKIGSKTMYINDEPKEIDVPPTIVEGRTLLPIRWVAEPLGADVSWDGEERKVTVSLNDTTIELWIGKPTARVNGEYKPIDPNNPKVVPMILNGRTMLPVRFVAENLGADVLWDGTTKTVTIIYPKE